MRPVYRPGLTVRNLHPPSVAVSNITQISGFDPAWDGDFLVATLKANTLFRVRVKDDRVIFAEPIEVGRRIRYAHQHTDGRIILWTDAGTLIFVTKADITPESELVESIIARMDTSRGRKDALQTAIDGCSECHALSRNDDIASPSLGDVVNRPVASTGYPGYSKALRSLSGVWTPERLTEFLVDPNAYAPGTTMPDMNLSADVAADVAYVLAELQAPE